MTFRYEVLGSVRVLDSGAPRSLTANKVEVLLATLLVEADRVVTAEALMREIWGENLPRRATAGLYVYISELRKFLTRPDRIETRGSGYRLDLGADQLDARRFQELASEGREHLRELRYEDACAYLEAALSLWQGPALGGIGTGPILRGFATRLAETRTECTELLVDARLQLGHHRQLIGLLYTLVTQHPLREAFHRQLMLALYRSERRADALAVYQSARATLIDELGIEPCLPMQELHSGILRGDASLLGLAPVAA